MVPMPDVRGGVTLPMRLVLSLLSATVRTMGMREVLVMRWTTAVGITAMVLRIVQTTTAT